MKRTKPVLFLILAVAVLSHRSDGQQPRAASEQLKLAAVMPAGAIVYAQASDLSSLMKSWFGSTVRDRFYKSPSFTAFSRSRIYLKLQDRRKDFETALGFGLDENRLAELAGGLSAVAMYDIGKLELVFVSDAPRERTIATTLFKNASKFQERSADGVSYYVRDITTDGGRLNQQFCFSYSEGKLIVTTAEGLMIRSLKNLKDASSDSLLPTVMAGVQAAGAGFTTHQVTLWLDQAKLNKNRYFAANWIYGTHAGSLEKIQSGLIDLEITKAGLVERRWFQLAGAAASIKSLTGDETVSLNRMAPADAQLIEVHAPSEALAGAVSQALLGKLPDLQPASWHGANEDNSSSSSDDESEEGHRTGRYVTLDPRFDKDVDDEQIPSADSSGPKPSDQLDKRISALLDPITPSGYLELARSRMEAGKPFVRFERAVVIGMQAADAFDRGAFEKAITDELRLRFVVKGVDPKLEWHEEAGVRYIAQSLLEQAASYAISDKHLVLSSSRELVRDILQAKSAQRGPALTIEGPIDLYARVRISAAKPVFDKLMSKLDGRFEASGTADQGSDNEIKFFSENLSSLIGATGIETLEVRRTGGRGSMFELVTYSW